MENKELVKLMIDRKEEDFVYQLTKIVAESDSIGEGYGYCDNYDRNKFNIELNHILCEEKYEYIHSLYLYMAGLPLYGVHLKHIGIIM